MEQMEEKPGTMKILAMFVALISLVALIAGLSLALFQYAKLGEEENVATTGTLIMSIDETGAQDIELTDVYPVSDEVGLAQQAYIFKVKNTGTLPAKYQIRLVKDPALYPNGSTDNTDSSFIKYGFKKGEAGEVKTGYVDDNDGILMTGETIDGGGTTSDSYYLWVWIDGEKEIPGDLLKRVTIEFHGRVQIEAAQTNSPGYTG